MSHHPPPRSAAHILSFAQTLQGGGVERAQLRLVRGWLEQGRRVTLVIGDAGGPLAGELPDGATLIELGSSRYDALLRVARYVRALAPDVIFCPGNHYTAVAAALRLQCGRTCPPIVAKVSNVLVRPEQNRLVAWGYRQWLRLHPLFLDHLVAMSPAMANEAVAQMRMPRPRVSVIANPPAGPVPDSEPVVLPPGPFIVGVGRLEPQKRWDRLIAALPRLADKTVKLLLIGEGSARAAIEHQVAALGLGARVLMPGHARDPLPALKGATVAALTSDYEGVPGVLREALSQGTPVVTTDASVAVREIVHAPELGSVVPREDDHALVAALDYWLEPGRPRPAPQDWDGDPVGDYLAMFDSVVAQRNR